MKEISAFEEMVHNLAVMRIESGLDDGVKRNYEFFTDIPAKRRQEVTAVEWSEYMIMAAQHSRKSASLWFRYLRKYIDQCGSLFSIQDVENLYRNDALTPFQRVSLKAAFQDESPTRQYIISLNQRVNPSRITSLKEKYEHTDSHK